MPQGSTGIYTLGRKYIYSALFGNKVKIRDKEHGKAKQYI